MSVIQIITKLTAFFCRFKTKMKRFSTSVLVVMLFATIYIFCITVYTFLSGLNSTEYFASKVYPNYDALSRLRRTVAEDNNTSKNDIAFNVCCDQDEYLNTELECVKFNVTKQDKNFLLANAFVVDKYLTHSTIELDRIAIKYKFKDLCPRDEMKVIIWPEGKLYYYYISDENGYLLELSHDRKGVASNFPTSSFCLDVMAGPEDSRNYAALLCPCKDKVCIPKCCPEGFYYNTITSSCKESNNGIGSYKPNFPENVYHLMHNVPDCDGPDSMIITENQFLPFTVLENGQLAVLAKENTTFDRKKYCVDIFSNGYQNVSYVNGFYCPNTILPLVKTGVLPDSIHEVEYSPNTSNSVHFGFFLMLLCLLLSVL